MRNFFAPMRNFFAKDGVRKFSRTVLPFIVVFLVGLGLLIWYPKDWCCGEFVSALRDALLIAGLIGAGIEVWSVSVLVDHATDQLSERLVGYGLPRAAQELIHDLVHKTKRVYRDYRALYRIDPHPTNADHVTVTIMLSYKVVNNGLGSESYSPILQEEGMYSPTLLSLEYANKAYTPNDLQPEVSETGVVTFAPDKKVSIAPSNAAAPIEALDKDQRCFVKWEFTLDMPKNYSTVIAFTGVTVNPVVEVQGSEEFEFKAATGKECACPLS